VDRFSVCQRLVAYPPDMGTVGSTRNSTLPPTWPARDSSQSG